jgi:hypothetical protein
MRSRERAGSVDWQLASAVPIRWNRLRVDFPGPNEAWELLIQLPARLGSAQNLFLGLMRVALSLGQTRCGGGEERA